MNEAEPPAWKAWPPAAANHSAICALLILSLVTLVGCSTPTASATVYQSSEPQLDGFSCNRKANPAAIVDVLISSTACSIAWRPYSGYGSMTVLLHGEHTTYLDGNNWECDGKTNDLPPRRIVVSKYEGFMWATELKGDGVTSIGYAADELSTIRKWRRYYRL